MMFLQENRHNQVPDVDKLDTNLSNRMKHLRDLREQLRKRFRIEYLGQLSRPQTKKGYEPVREGDIMLIGQDNLKRMDWPLARVIEILPGRDGVVRVVKLKTADGELVRLIQWLYPLEMSAAVNKSVADARQQEEEIVTPPREVRTRSGRCIKAPDRLRI